MKYATRADFARSENQQPDKPKASAKGFRRRFILPMVRLSELVRLARWRAGAGHPIDAAAFMTVAAHAIADLAGMRVRNKGRHPGLDFETATNFLLNAGQTMEEDDIMHIVHAVEDGRNCRDPFRMKPPLAGQITALTQVERTGLGIVTMEASDETAAARKARKAEEKRNADRERQREKRRSAGCRIGPSIESKAPWKDLGISRATYFRRKGSETRPHRETAPSRTYIKNVERHSSLTLQTRAVAGAAEGQALAANLGSDVAIDLERYRARRQASFWRAVAQSLRGAAR